MAKLEIKNLHVNVGEKEILKGVNLVINSNEVHAIMGPNGHGKSTLLAAVMGNPKFTVTEGSITLDGQDVLSMEVDERSKAGVFLGMQYPLEVSGVTNSDFLKAAINARREKPIALFEFIRLMDKNLKALEMKPDLAHRFLNEGFSGGEKKRNEILHMLLLNPKIAMLDEIDSGLDVDALKIVAKAVEDRIQESNTGFMVVSHYERFLKYLKPTHAHIMIDGVIVMSDGEDLVTKIDTEGYDWLMKEYGYNIYIDEKQPQNVGATLGSCGVNQNGK